MPTAIEVGLKELVIVLTAPPLGHNRLDASIGFINPFGGRLACPSSSSTEPPAVSGAKATTTINVTRPTTAMSVIVVPMPNASTSTGKTAVHTTPPSSLPPILSQVDWPMARIGVGYCSAYHIL